MTIHQFIVFTTLLGVLILFVLGRWRYDVVALLGLLVITVTGVVTPENALAGFGHPAVIIVGAVLVVSRALLNAGLVDVISGWLGEVGASPVLQIGSLTALVTFLSGIMSSVGALALLIPVAIRTGRRHGTSPSQLLMPLAFGSLLGALLTLIGSTPNIIISTFRDEALGRPFRMFDYTPVGIAIAAAGVLFIALIGWRLIPDRRPVDAEDLLFRVSEYFSEVRVPVDSRVIGMTLRELGGLIESEVVVAALEREEEERILAPSGYIRLQEGDILIVEATATALEDLLSAARLELVGSKISAVELGSDEVGIMEVVVSPGSTLVGRSATQLNLRHRYGINLLAIARQGEQLSSRLGRIQFQAGDVLLLQGRLGALQEGARVLGALPLAERGLRIGLRRKMIPALLIFLSAIIASATGLLTVEIAFLGAAVLMILSDLISLREAYESVNWPILVLLGSMIPIGEALESSGGAELIADQFLTISLHTPPALTVAIILIGTMFLSDIVNNAAAAVLMAPIALRLSQALQVSPDPLLMAVAVGASCAFLTPIGHQSNTLVMGPGGYRFSDYWRMGLPLEIIIVLVAIPTILLIWPL